MPSAIVFPAVRIEHWGSVPYGEALRRQRQLCRMVGDGLEPATVVSLEHPPTLTLGRHAPNSDIVVGGAELDRRGIELLRSDRGGRATYHGPGQAVVYPIVRLADFRLGVRSWVSLLEEAVVELLAGEGIRGRRRRETAGVWVGEDKISSIGLRIVRGVSYHGVSLNVDLDVSGFDCIVTCGAPGQTVTDMTTHGALPATATEVSGRLAQAIGESLEARRMQ